MCSLQFKGVLGDVGAEFSGAVGGRPPIALDEEDVRQEVSAGIDRELDADDLVLGTYASPLFQTCEALCDPRNAFATQRVAWPAALREKDLFASPDPKRDVESHYRISLTVDETAECNDDVVDVGCDVTGLSQFYVNGILDTDFWNQQAEQLGPAHEGEGEDLLKAMERDTQGLCPPGWSAPLLIDTSQDLPLCGAGAAQASVSEKEPQTSALRNATQKYYTKQVDEAQLVAEGRVNEAKAKQKKTVQNRFRIADEGCHTEVDTYDFDLLKAGESDVKRNWVNTELLDVSEFSTLVPNPAVSYPFEMDNFQKQAIARIEMNENVFVAAHTSAGKTVVAEYAIGLAKSRGTRVLYTSPIKTLSNQKYRDFKEKFGDDVGILTGDVQLNPRASCLIMTTEILRSALYQSHNAAMGGITGLDSGDERNRRSDMLHDVEYVIFDEVHYVNDAHRGYVWEEVIILLPKTVKLVMLSATVPNINAFADWVGRTRQSRVNVVMTQKRPVPLHHSILCNDKEFPLVTEGKRFSPEGYKGYAQIAQVSSQNSRPLNRDARMKNEAREWRNMIGHLSKKDRLPIIIFAFSKQRLDDLSDHLGSMNFTSKKEKWAIETYLRQVMARLKGSDKSIPQVQKIFRLLRNGLAVHHAGLMPIMKEIVEQLFCQGFIRVLFATETFAMGVNAPARCVIFADTHKFDGGGKRPLQPGEYTQMSGRAGRRGLDTVGYVYLYASPNSQQSQAAGSGFIGNIPSQDTLKQMLTGPPVELVSKFRLTYAMVLNCLGTAGSLDSSNAPVGTQTASFISYLLRNSFAEARANKYFPVYRALQERYEQEAQACTEKMRALRGEHSDKLMGIFGAVRDFVHASRSLAAALVSETKEAQRVLSFGTVVVLEVSPMTFTLGYVVRLQGFNDMQCFILAPPEEDGFEQAGRAYNITAYLVPKSLAETGVVEEVVIQRSKIIAVLAAQHNVFAGMPQGEPAAVDSRRAAPPMMQLKKKDDDDDGFFGGGKKGKGKQKDTKKPPMPLPAAPVQAASSGPSLVALLNDKDKLRELGDKLRTLVSEGFDTKEGVQKAPQTSVDAIEDQRDVDEIVEVINDFGAIHGEDMTLAYERHNAERRSDVYRNASSDDSLFLMPEFKGRIEVLEHLGMVQPSDLGGDVYDLLPKGRCASVISSMDAVIATELIYDCFFDDLPPQTIAAALSCFICNERATDIELPSELTPVRKRLTAVVEGLWEVQQNWILDSKEDYVANMLNFSICEAVWEWAHGTSFLDIIEVTNAREGTLIRDITRLDNLCREIRTAARTLGDTTLQEKMLECSNLIRRDVVFCQSLYLD